MSEVAEDPVGASPFTIMMHEGGVSYNDGPPHRKFQMFWGGLSVLARGGRFPSDGYRLTISRDDEVLMDIEHATFFKAFGRDGAVSVEWSKGGSVSHQCLQIHTR